MNTHRAELRPKFPGREVADSVAVIGTLLSHASTMDDSSAGRDPITVKMKYYTSTPNKYRYKAPEHRDGRRPVLGDIYLDIGSFEGEPPSAIEVQVRFL